MTFNEYYGFPQGTNATQKYMVSGWHEIPEAELPTDCSYMFYRSMTPYLCNWDTSKVTDAQRMFEYAKITTLTNTENWDMANVTNMSNMFSSCTSLMDISGLANWDVSNLTNMSNMFSGSIITDVSPITKWKIPKVTNLSNIFNNCTKIVEIDLSGWDTSKVTDMDSMVVGTSSLTTFGAIDCSSVEKNKYPLQAYGNDTHVVNLGGFLNMKSSWDENYGLSKYPNLTYESCINVLDGLYDFTGNGQTPSSTQGKLKVNANFLTLVGDEISIGTDKGWTITA